MKIGLIGLGKMGFNLAINLKRNGHHVTGFDASPETLQMASQTGIHTVSSVTEVVDSLPLPRIIWLMVPAGKAVDSIMERLKLELAPGDIIIDGGNSNYKDTVTRARALQELGIRLLDCGTSGGVEGALNGVCAMIGGDKGAFEICTPLFESIAVPGGFLHCGASGSGHYVKMVHNGIEYGMMQAIAEGFEVLKKSGFGIDLGAVAGLWNQGSVVRSWLMELTAKALDKEEDLASIKGVVQSSGEGKWTLETALEKQIATPVIALSVLMRYRSLEEDTFSGRLLAALRQEFGGHQVIRQELPEAGQ
ncbi:MAG TPA: decarboxylating 6-phosphogluconate dehydrogenase [Sphingobacteriaceae bacterium]